ncbi:MAG: hypothetical protein OXC68_03805 [Aestuariivita sp.]|nr:hypothetical protein [Aestuariivita sp.]
MIVADSVVAVESYEARVLAATGQGMEGGSLVIDLRRSWITRSLNVEGPFATLGPIDHRPRSFGPKHTPTPFRPDRSKEE